VAITDLMELALSAVYTFYDPDERARGLGTLAILKQIEWRDAKVATTSTSATGSQDT
jgi:arginyl-tRNA--protein-N-Asp/Glu arginylyltransferase